MTYYSIGRRLYALSPTKKLRNTILMTLTCGFFCLGFRNGDNNQVIDHHKLASQYFNEDTQWYLENIPFFECSDKNIQEVYYYRWKLYKAHIRNVGNNQYVITEFINDVPWDRDPYSSINLASGQHILEGRWLKGQRYVNGYIDYLNAGGGNNRQYTENVAFSTYECYLVNADSAFTSRQFDFLQNGYNQWADHYDPVKKLYYMDPLHDGTEYTISAIDASGGINGSFGGGPLTNDGIAVYEKGAQEAFFGGEAYRPTINCSMYGNAMAISHIAALAGNTIGSDTWKRRAELLKKDIVDNLWNDSLSLFADRYHITNQYVQSWNFIRGRELAGLIPWFYNMPDNTPKYNSAWKSLVDTDRFMGQFGLRTLEPSYPYYMKQFKFRNGKPDCQWNGPSWPYLTAQVLTGMANLLDNYSQDIVTPSDYLKVLRQFTQQHYYNNGKTTILNLQEDYNPDTGKPVTYQRAYGSDHYNHSCYTNLIITGLCGIRPSKGNTLTIRPLLDHSIQYFCLEEVMYHGHKITLVYDKDGSKYKLGKGLTVFVDKKKALIKEDRGKFEVETGAPIVNRMPQPNEDLALNIRRNDYPIPSASVNSVPDSLYQAIDGRTWYFPEVTNRWSTLGSSSASDWYALDFGKTRHVSSIRLCFYTDNKTYGKPDCYTIEYKSGTQWLPVKIKNTNPSSTVGNTENTTLFYTVTTDQIRINFKNKARQLAIALTEIECY
jgi:hypothetical protein